MKQIADIYVRLSEQDRDKKNPLDESESIQNQKTMLINYCIEKGWQINGIYVDEDYSGVDSNRPQWNALLKDCEQGRCTVVVCKTQSRFSRDIEMIERYLHGKFSEWGVRFVGVVDNADTSIKGNKKARQINGLINEWYLEDLSENVRSTLSAKRKSGDFVGSFAPYGYLVDPVNKNRLVIDLEAASVVKRIFKMYLSGNGYINIAKALNDDRVPPPCVRKKQLSSRYYNANFERSASPFPMWSASSVYTILRRREYTGALVQGRGETVNFKTGKRRQKPVSEWDITESAHQPIITKGQFDAAEHLRQQRGRGQKIPNGLCHSLAKKVFCAECGNSMWKMSYKLPDGRYHYLTCRSRKTSKDACCNAHSIRCDQLEELVLSEINKLLKIHFDKKLIGALKAPKSPQTTPNDSDVQTTKQLQRDLLKCKNDLAQMYQDRLDGVITAEQYVIFSQMAEQHSAQIKNRIQALKSQPQIQQPQLNPDDIIERFKHIDCLDLFIAEQFIDSVHIGALDEQNERTVKIVWRI